MLVKLLKYDLKYMLKNMSIFYVLALFFAVLTRILFSIEQSVIVNFIGQISVGCMFSMLASILINVIMRSWVRFRDSIYKDEGYLTNTLPVTKNAIYDSKFIQTLMFFIFGFVVIIISLFIAYYTEDRLIMLKEFINTITSGLNFDTTLFIVSVIMVVFLEVFNAIQCGFLGIILGYRKNNNKIIFAVLFGFIGYLLSQGIVLMLIFIVGLFNSSVMDLFTSNILLDVDSFKLLIGLTIVLYLLVIGGMNIICKKLFNRGINVE